MEGQACSELIYVGDVLQSFDALHAVGNLECSSGCHTTTLTTSWYARLTLKVQHKRGSNMMHHSDVCMMCLHLLSHAVH